MTGFASMFTQKAQRMTDAQLEGFVKRNAKSIHDWRNWGNNLDKIIATEAHKRGLFDSPEHAIEKLKTTSYKGVYGLQQQGNPMRHTIKL